MAAESGGDFYKSYAFSVTNRAGNCNTGEEHVSRATSRRLVGVCFLNNVDVLVSIIIVDIIVVFVVVDDDVDKFLK